ncbi:MAG: DUF445 family protein [Muribaculaceae bacterium]|nr:DUF445 family protein [Muribaculaceae bacterium]
MGFDFTLLLGPVIGAAIGYITNDLAIRMMFRPHQAKYVFGIRVPFTPGIVPKEKHRIADSIGAAISENLMNREVLEKSLLSQEMMRKLNDSFDELMTAQKSNTDTVRQLLARFLNEDEIDKIKDDTCAEFATQMHTRLDSSNLGDMISHAVIQHVIEKMSGGVMGFLGADKMMSHMADAAEKLLTKHVNQIIANNSEQLITRLVDKEATTLLQTHVCQLLDGHDHQIDQLKQVVMNIYHAVITEHLPRILATIDINSIVRDRINEMDMDETERIIFGVIKKELRAIVWLGALLGAVIGTVNTLF